MKLDFALEMAGAFLVSLVLVACGGGTVDENPSSSATSASTGSGNGGGGGSGGGSGTGGGGGSGSGSGSGGGVVEEKPSIHLEKIGTPAWEIVDWHRRVTTVGPNWEHYVDACQETLPPPNHDLHDDLFVGPGLPHAGPYDHEMADSYAAHQWEEKSTFESTEVLAPYALLETYMVVPSTGAPTGKTPDEASGPMMPNTIFPIHYAAKSFADEKFVVGSDDTFDVPALDENLNPPFNVDGHSHFPIFHFRRLNDEDIVVGHHAYRGTIVDAQGNGYSFETTFTVVE